MKLSLFNQISNQLNSKLEGFTLGKSNHSELNALKELLAIDTKLPNSTFLKQFSQLKNTHPFINNLCQKSLLGSSLFATKISQNNVEQYLAKIDQLKRGLSTNNDHDIAYYSAVANYHKSVCEKIEEIKQEYLLKTYPDENDENYKADRKIFDELTNFNDNLGFPPSQVKLSTLQLPVGNDIILWQKLININPEYLSFGQNNGESANINIHNRSVQGLKQELFQILNLPQDTLLFGSDNKFNPEVVVALLHRHKAATTIQHHVRDFQKRLKSVEPDNFGIRHLKYNNNNQSKTYLFTKNLVGHSLPEVKIKKGSAGAFKQVIGKDENNILFNQKKDPQAVFDSNTVEEILLKLNITSFKVTTKISQDSYIAHTAGEADLKTEISQYKRRFAPSYFKKNLQELKIMHENGYFHYDIKPGNIMVGKRGPNVIDLDSLSSVEKFHSVYTPNYIDLKVIAYQYDYLQYSGSEDLMKILNSIRDEYAFALTLLEARGIDVPNNNFNYRGNGRLGDLQITPEISSFIFSYIKPEHQDKFRALVQNPAKYFLNNQKSKTYLVDMLK